MRILNLIGKDLLQIFKDGKSFVIMLVMPLAFTLFMGFITTPGDNADPRLKIGLLNLDKNGALIALLDDLLSASTSLAAEQLEESDSSRIDNLVVDGTHQAVLIIPPSFSQQFLNGDNPQLELIADPSSNTGRLAQTAVQTLVNRWLGSVRTGQISANALKASLSDTAEAESMMEGANLALAAWQDPPIALSVRAVKVDQVIQETPSGFSQTSPGMIMQFTILGLLNSAMILVHERKNRSLQRMLTTPINRAEIIVGHTLAMSAIIFIQQLLLVIAGQLFFKVDYFNAPLATLLVMIALSIMTGCLGLLISSLAKKEEQVILFSLISMFILTAMGGAWFPLQGVSEGFYTIGHLTPLAWAMDGYQNVILRGGGLESVLLPAGVMGLYALIFFGLAVWRFRFE